MSNLSGFAGLKTEQTADDSVIICGTDANISGSMIKDDYGRSRNKFMASDTTGMMKIPAAFPEVRAVDNSGDHEGGSYTIIAMNKFNVDAACGGINMNSAGNITLMAGGGILNLVSETLVELHGEMIKADAANIVRFSGPTMDIACDEINCINVTKFHSNAMVEGGLFVKGELYAPHITSQREEWWTEEVSPLSVYFNQNLNIKALGTIKQVPPSSDGKLKDGATFMLDVNLMPPTTQAAAGYTNPHDHMFYHIAADLKDDAQQVWSDGSSTASSSPVKTKPKNSFSKRLKKIVTKRVKGLTKTLIGKMGF